MPYCTIDDLTADSLTEEELVQLTDDEGLGQVNEDRADQAAGAAADWIDGYLRGRYTLPLNPVPGMIRDIAVQETIYRLYRRRRKENMPESLVADRRDRIRLLEGIQKGSVTLDAAAPSGESGKGGYRTNKTAENRAFTDDELGKW